GHAAGERARTASGDRHYPGTGVVQPAGRSERVPQQALARVHRSVPRSVAWLGLAGRLPSGRFAAADEAMAGVVSLGRPRRDRGPYSPPRWSVSMVLDSRRTVTR